MALARVGCYRLCRGVALRATDRRHVRVRVRPPGMSIFQPFVGQQVYIERGRYCRLHAKVTGFPKHFRGFVFVQLYSERGEITKQVDLVPVSYIRALAADS